MKAKRLISETKGCAWFQFRELKPDKNFFESKCATFDRQIDQLVYELYDLTPEEIAIVEGSGQCATVREGSDSQRNDI